MSCFQYVSCIVTSPPPTPGYYANVLLRPYQQRTPAPWLQGTPGFWCVLSPAGTGKEPRNERLWTSFLPKIRDLHPQLRTRPCVYKSRVHLSDRPSRNTPRLYNVPHYVRSGRCVPFVFSNISFYYTALQLLINAKITLYVFRVETRDNLIQNGRNHTYI